MNLKRKIEAEGLELDERFWQKIEIYKELLFTWNKTHNLTGVRSEEQLDAFIFDALFPLSFLQAPKTMLDIGTGAGFPGLILAFAWSDTEVVLAEPLGKRASFLQFVKAKLDLKNVTVMRKRAEELPPRVFDLITSRAVTEVRLLLQISKNLRDEHTKLLFYKGERVFEEVPDDLPHKVIMAHKRHYLLIESSND